MAQVKMNTPHELPKVTILEQTPERIYSRQEYSNGFILVTDITLEGIKAVSNFNWIIEADGSVSPNYSSPNPDFVDPRH